MPSDLHSARNRVTVEFVSTPLKDVIKFIKALTDVEFVLDDFALSRFGVKPDSQISISRSGSRWNLNWQPCWTRLDWNASESTQSSGLRPNRRSDIGFHLQWRRQIMKRVMTALVSIAALAAFGVLQAQHLT